MDKQYKPLFLRELKRLMALHFPNFTLVRVPKDHPQREVLTGALLFAAPVLEGGAIWLWWVPGPGVERYFDVSVGWSPGPNEMPTPKEHDPRLYSLRGPSREIPAAAIPLQQIQGESAIGGYTIPSPWDQVAALKPMAPKREHVAVMQKAESEAAALTTEQRDAAVAATLGSVFAALRHVMPAFTRSLGPAASDA